MVDTTLRNWRLQQQLSLRQVAYNTGIWITLLGQIERGDTRARPSRRALIAHRLGVSVTELFADCPETRVAAKLLQAGLTDEELDPRHPQRRRRRPSRREQPQGRGPVSRDELRAAAIAQNERDAAEGRCARYIEDVSVLAQVAAMVAATPAREGGEAA